ncbi:hypothetical protein [Pedobacter frigoris]|uniref:hypothetical protein n=1 Tax=Pedobacter frigoris TaxID=2571272 RepID=UPI00292FE17F|nr:hypothetical protein [Pedobacter frigoris]
MKRLSHLIFAIGLYLMLIPAFNSSAQTLPQLNESWPNATPNSGGFIPSGIHPGSFLKVDGIDFHIVTEKGKVKYIDTNDKKFKIDGVSYIGLKLSDFKNKAEVKKYLGWGHYLPIKDGWYALFHYESINDSSKAVAVFKYQFH